MLLCSPEAAASHWVAQELSWWLRHRGEEHLLLIVTGGRIAVDPATGELDPVGTTCLPAFAVPLFDTEPLWVDLTWAGHSAPTVPIENARFLDLAATLAAAVSGMPKDELVGENIRQQRRTRNLVRSVIAILTVLILLAAGGGVVAVQQRNLAQAQLLRATSRQLVASAAGLRDTQPALARQLIVTAYRQAATSEAIGAVLGSATIPVGSFDRPDADLIVADPIRNLAAFAYRDRIDFRSTDDAAVVATVALPGRTTQLAYAGGGDLLAAADVDGVVRIWSLSSPTAPRPWSERTLTTPTPKSPTPKTPTPTPKTIVAGLTFVGASRMLAVLTATGDLRVLDAGSAGELPEVTSIPGTLEGQSGRLMASADGRRILTCQEKPLIWDSSAPGSPLVVGPLDLPDCGGRFATAGATLSPSGFLLAVATGDLATLYDIADPARPVPLAPLAGPRLGVDAFAFSGDGSSLAIGAGDGSIRIWNVADPLRPALTDQLEGLGGAVTQLVFSGDSASLIAQIRAEVSNDSSSGWVRIWRVRAGERSAQLGEIATYGTQVGFAAESALIVAGHPPRLWGIADRRRPIPGAIIGGYRFGGGGLAISRNGALLALGVPPVLYDVTDPAAPVRLTVSPPSDDEPSRVDFLSGDRHLVVLDDDPTLWDVTDHGRPRRLSTLKADAYQQQSLAISPSGQRLVVVDAGVTVVYDISDPTAPTPAFHGLTPGAKVAAFAGGEDTIVTGDDGGRLRVWRADHGQFVEIGSAERHTGSIGGIGTHPAQPWVATGGEDGTVRLWDLLDPAHPAELAVYRHGGLYRAASIWFSPDGRTLATAGSSSIRLWDVDLAGTLGQLCDLSPDITPAEWSAYLPALPYDPPCR